MEYHEYEIGIADDSTDETYELLKSREHSPRIKISDRTTREGYREGILREALKVTAPRAEVFDVDFIPYPDMILQFLRYMKVTVGNLEREAVVRSSIGAVQGYHWHLLRLAYWE